MAPEASAQTLRVNARGQIGIVSSGSSTLQIAGTLRGAGLGQGALLARIRPTAGGYTGTLTIVDGDGSVQASLRASERTQGSLLYLTATAPVTAASGGFRGARGTLRGSMILTGDGGVGVVSLAGNLHGVGRAPGPALGLRSVSVDARMQGTSVGLARNGQETIVGAITGLVPGVAVAVLQGTSTATVSRDTLTVISASGTLTGRIDLRRGSGPGPARTETGTAVVTGGTEAFRGARTVAPAGVRLTPDLVAQLLDLTFRGRISL